MNLLVKLPWMNGEASSPVQEIPGIMEGTGKPEMQIFLPGLLEK
jgi:hypothetical protein